MSPSPGRDIGAPAAIDQVLEGAARTDAATADATSARAEEAEAKATFPKELTCTREPAEEPALLIEAPKLHEALGGPPKVSGRGSGRDHRRRGPPRRITFDWFQLGRTKRDTVDRSAMHGPVIGQV
ncbi:MAG: hypothetical protein AAFU80_08920 [Pseudomonadota bacterium]